MHKVKFALLDDVDTTGIMDLDLPQWDATAGKWKRLSRGLIVPANFAFVGDISPSQITADQNNYNPTGLSTASVLRINSDAARNITGLQGGSDGRVLVIYNIGSFSITLKNASGSSTAANRFALNSDYVLKAGGGCSLVYDSTASRWVVWAQSDVGTSGTSLTVKEVDGTPSGTPSTLEFPNGTITDHGGGVYEYVPTGGGSSSPLTTKGDTWGYSTVDARVPVGIDGEPLVSDSTQSLGIGYGVSYAAAVLADSPVGFWKLDDASGTTATDYASSPHNGTYQGSPTLAAAGPWGANSMQFDGTNDDVRITHNAVFNITGDLTISLWIRPTTSFSTKMLVTKDTGGGGASNTFELRFNTGTIRFLQFAGSVQATDSINLPPMESWHHIAAVKEGTGVSFYVDGSYFGSGGVISGTVSTNSSDVLIGARDDGTTFYTGRMYGVAIFNTALRPERIRAHAMATKA